MKIKPSNKSVLSVADMTTLLDVYDALEDLDKALGLIIGYEVGIGSESGLMKTFGKVTDLICKNSPIFSSNDDDKAWFYNMMDDRTMDNNLKARLFLGVSEDSLSSFTK